MCRGLIIIFIFIFCCEASAQTEKYYVTRAPFSSPKFDEFSPAYLNSRVVFCSNKTSGKISGYTTTDNKAFFKMYIADTSLNMNEARPVEGDVNSVLNNGPASFNKRGDTMYFSRNLIVEGNLREIAGKKNRLGLFRAVLKDGRWTEVTELRFNDDSWNVTTPALSPDSKRLYFASDKPDGFGGSDIYYSDWQGSYWGNPVNLGSDVNTGGNEAYPFVNEMGLFFSSDSLGGQGGKDIYFTRFADTSWTNPVALGAPVNSKADDFGLVTDDAMRTGYFSTDREKMLDIYMFRTITPEFIGCRIQKDIDLCFTFSDDNIIETDPVSMQFRWEFEGGKSYTGYIVKHCFPGPGSYRIRQDITDRKTGRVILNKSIMTVHISPSSSGIISGDRVSAGKEIKLSAGPADGDHEVTGYYWDVAGSQFNRLDEIRHTFTSPGEYPVRLISILKNKVTGRYSRSCVTKNIRVNGSGDKIPGDTDHVVNSWNEWIIRNSDKVRYVYNIHNDLSEKAVFAVEIMNSEKLTDPDGSQFERIRPDYRVKAVRMPDGRAWSYIIDEQPSFLAAYFGYRKAVAAGYRSALIRTFVPTDTGEIELWNFKRTYGTGSELYFMNNGTTISRQGATMLDRLVLLLNRNPELNISIAVHTSSSSSQYTDLQLTVKQARSIADYLAGKGISRDRLEAEGYGSSRPVASEYPESEKMKNRRVDFVKSVEKKN